MNNNSASMNNKQDTFPKYLLRNARIFANRPAFREKDLGIWQTWTWKDVLNEVMYLALGLQKLGLKRGDSISVIGDNRPSLYWTFMAAQSLGALPVPAYQDSVAEELAFVLKDANIKFVMAENQEQVDKILQLVNQISSIETIIYDNPRGLRNYDRDDTSQDTDRSLADKINGQVLDGNIQRILSFKRLQEIGREVLTGNVMAKDQWLEKIEAGKGSDRSVLLYTSGTTGKSKGVILTAKGCIDAAKDTVRFDKLTENDVALAYLPLAWVGDHYLNYAQGMVAGFCLACPESPETVQENLREIGPTFYFAPPRVFEVLLTQVMIRMEDAGMFKRWLFKYFMEIAKKYGEAILDKQSVPFYGRILYALGGLFIYGPLKNRLGLSNIRVAYTAGEAIGPDLFSFYRSLGLNLKQLYGQTEAFLYVTCQKDGDIKADTVGPPAPNVEIRLADNGEVQFKSPGMFAGYLNDPEKTAETMTEDGFIKTGDAGFFDESGHLKIIDRAKDVGKLKNGILFPPKYIENKLKFFPNIKEAVAFGDNRDFCTAFINIDLIAVGNWAEKNNISYASYQELAANALVYEIIERHVDEVNRSLADEPRVAGAQIRRFLILHKELDADDGELTRTQKVRRGFILERYQALVNALYDGSDYCHIVTEVTFEDGRKGAIEGDVKIMDMKIYESEDHRVAAE